MFEDDDPFLMRLRRLALEFPDAAEKVSHGRPAFYTAKVFAYYGGSEKDGASYRQHDQSIMVLVPADERPALLQDPRCYLPMYLGPSGWVGLDLDGDTEWGEVLELVEASYRLTAGPRRVARLRPRPPMG